MQPFLCRASISITRHSNSHCCCFSSASSAAVNYNYTYRLSNISNTLNTSATECPLRRKFGEFYKRFYSVMSGTVVVGGEDSKSCNQPGEKKESTNDSVEGIGITRALARRNRRRRLAEIMSKEGTAGTLGVSADDTFLTRTERPRRPPPGGKRKLHPTQRFVPKERRLLIEKSTIQLTSRFLEHDRLCRELRAQIKRRQLQSDHPEIRHETEALEKSISEEIGLLKRTLRYITTHYYEPPKSDPSDPSESTSEPSEPTTSSLTFSNFRTTQVPWFTPYLPPFPDYTSGHSATILNRSLVKLLLARPPPPALVPKICYNLLTSPSPPNVHTYNILIEGLTRVRHGFLGHVVFRNMVEGGLGPKGRPNEDTIVRMLHLCVKTSDREGFHRIINITSHRNMANWWGFGSRRSQKTREQKRRGKMVLEAMINGAARFGDAKLVRVWLRAMRRECPGSPNPSMYLLTSLIRMWTEMKNWDMGLRCWRDLMRLDLVWRRERIGEPADSRAFRQMLKLCKECDKPKMYEKILQVAVGRGWTKKELSNPISKTKGLWVRRENKTPHIRGQRGSTQDGASIMKALEQLWAAEDMEQEGEEEARRAGGSEMEEREEVVDGSADGDISLVERTGPVVKQSMKKSNVSDAAKSKIWDDVIFRRMDDVRPGSARGSEIRQRFAQKQQQLQIRKGNYERGSSDEMGSGNEN